MYAPPSLEPRASPFIVSSFVWEPQGGRFALTAIAVAMARLSHGREATWTDPAGVEPLYDEAQALVARANHVAPYKPRVDVVVVGHAYSPPGTDADRVLARIRLGDFSKAISVTGDRLWVREGPRWGSSAPRPFSRMLLVPERALRSAENPVGLDPAAIPVEGRLSLPNLEPAAGSYSAILGPIPAAAPSRRNVLNPTAAQWLGALEMGHRPGPVPEGFNFAFFNFAPLDQQLNDVPAGSALVLENLHPREPIFTSRLPPAGPSFTAVDPSTGRHLELRARCDTVWVDTDREIAMMVYRASCELERPDLPIQIRAEIERPPARPSPTSPGQTLPHPASMLVTQQGSLAAPSTGLPFGGRPGMAPPGGLGLGTMPGAIASPGAPPAWARAGDLSPDSRRHGAQMAQAYAAPHDGAAGVGPVKDEVTSPLPTSSGSYPPPPPAPRERAITSEIVVAPEQALPFQQGSADSWDTHTQDLEDTPGVLPRHDTPALVHQTQPPPAPAGSDLPFPQAVSPPATATSHAVHHGPSALGKRLAPRGPVGPVPDVGPTPPPHLPPKPKLAEAPAFVQSQPVAIAIPALGSRPKPESPPPAKVEPLAEAQPEPSAPEVHEPAPEPVVLRDQLSLAECAAVRAELSLKGSTKADVLDKHRLADATWARIEREHLRAIDEASQGGDVTLLEQYDDAYVSARDQLREPLDEHGYARLQLAKESGRLANLLEELSLSRADLLRLERVWRRRLQADKALAERLEDEIERLRHEG